MKYLILILLLGCTKELKQKNISPNTENFIKFPMDKQIKIPQHEYLFQFQNLTSSQFYELSEYLADTEFKNINNKMLGFLFKNPHTFRYVNLKESPYLDAALRMKEKEIKAFLAIQKDDLLINMELVKNSFDQIGLIYKSDISLTEAIQKIYEYNDNYVVPSLIKNQVHKEIVETYKDTFKNQFKVALEFAELEIKKFNKETKYKDITTTFIKTVDLLNLKPLTRNEYNQDFELMNRLNQIFDNKNSDSDEILKLFATLWIISKDEKQRDENFDFLNKKDWWKIFRWSASLVIDFRTFFKNLNPDEIEALSSGKWLNTKSVLEKLRRAQVFLKIKYYKEILNHSKPNEIKQTVENEITMYMKSHFMYDFFKYFPEKMSQAILKEMTVELETVEMGLGNYYELFNNIGGLWGEQNLLDGNKTFITPLSFNMDLESFKFKLNETLDASTIGNYLAFSSKYIENIKDVKQYRRWGMGILNTLILSGGYPIDEYNSSFSFFRAFHNPFETFNITKVLNYEEIFEIPDKMNNFDPFSFSQKYDSSVNTQSDLLKGYSQALNWLKNWEINQFDYNFKNVRVRDFDSKLKGEFSEQSLFPKNDLYEYTLAINGVLLKNLTKIGSRLVLMNSEYQKYLGNESDLAAQNNVFMAYLKDRISGELKTRIDIKSQAKFIIACSHFLNASQGIENAKGSRFNNETFKGKQILKQILEQREKLKLLLVGLGHFLTSQAIDSSGLVSDYWDEASGLSDKNNHSLMTQVFVMQALLELNGQTNIKLFKNTISAVYFNLNKNFWNEIDGLYLDKYENSYFYDQSLIYNILNRVKTDINDGTNEEFSSKVQLEKIIIRYKFLLSTNFSRLIN